jgi:hypothetical protein
MKRERQSCRRSGKYMQRSFAIRASAGGRVNGDEMVGLEVGRGQMRSRGTLRGLWEDTIKVDLE